VRVETVAVGTELLLGAHVNTNAAWLGERLAEHGIDVVAGTVIGDNVDRIAEALRIAAGRADAVVITGGLGPTQDDLTREALAALAGVDLVRDDALVEGLYARYAAAGRELPLRNLQQADVPAGATVLPNPNGSAPGLLLRHGGCDFYALPGVPAEMRAMFDVSVLPDLVARAGAGAIVSRTLHTIGLWESAVAELLGDLDAELGERRRTDRTTPTLAYLAGAGEVRVRITAKAADTATAQQAIEPVEAAARTLLGAAVFGIDGATIDGRIHELLRARAETVAVAESLTGGALGARLTDAAGASLTFRGGVLAYTVEAKTELLAVDPAVINESGIVSTATASAMAEGVCRRLAATWGLATTGVAGPDAHDGKEPGTVCIGLAGPSGTTARELRIVGDRSRVRAVTVVSALDLLRRRLEESGR
jgi:nicotinamide-nucleotide amidase